MRRPPLVVLACSLTALSACDGREVTQRTLLDLELDERPARGVSVGTRARVQGRDRCSVRVRLEWTDDDDEGSLAELVPETAVTCGHMEGLMSSAQVHVCARSPGSVELFATAVAVLGEAQRITVEGETENVEKLGRRRCAER